MEALREKIETLINSGKYNKASNTVAKELGLTLNVFANDTQSRHVFNLQLKRGRKSYSFEFGQSIANGGQEPTMYDVLACLQKYDVGSFTDFCSDFGYDEFDGETRLLNKNSRKTYKAVVKEFEAMSRLFNEDELEVLSYIQ